MSKAAPAARAALNQATALWPDRDKSSDGIIGDAAHAARKSDHNTGYSGYCHAWDLTHDPKHGVDTYALADRLRLRCLNGAEKRCTYVISNRRIASASQGWQWRTYKGTSPHTAHMHVSLVDTKDACEDVSSWHLVPDIKLKCKRSHGARKHSRWLSLIVGKWNAGDTYDLLGKKGDWLLLRMPNGKSAWGNAAHF